MVLANTFCMYLLAQKYHWNVEGPNFSQYHALFGDLYEQLFEEIDKDELWQNGEGWVGVEQMDSISVFDEREKNAIKNLPHGGEWVLCWSVPK